MAKNKVTPVEISARLTELVQVLLPPYLPGATGRTEDKGTIPYSILVVMTALNRLKYHWGAY